MKLGRHRGVEVDCQQCGNSFIALAQRIEHGLGKFCSKECFDNWQRENRKSDKWGKENAKAYLKAGGEDSLTKRDKFKCGLYYFSGTVPPVGCTLC